MTGTDAPQTPSVAEAPDAADVPDEIVRSIRIAADAQTVFDIVSEPDGDGDGSADGDGVILTVRETGFTSLDEDTAARRRRFEDNSAGWVEELELARLLSQWPGRGR